jgi:hypothetical protein
LKNARHLTLWTIIISSCLLMFTFAEDITKVIQAAESNARIVYKGKEVSLGVKPFSIEGSNYLSVRALAVLFDKNIDWNQKEQKIIISDKPNTVMDSLKLELSTKDKSIAELQGKVKKLENDSSSSKMLGIRELQEEINNTMGQYQGLTYKAILSGNKDEIRVKIEVDLSRDKVSWGRLTGTEKKGFAEEVYNEISREYAYAKIKGYIIDIASSKKLMFFSYNWEGGLDDTRYRNFSTISSLEERLNDDYCGYLKDTHVTIGLEGNENRVEYTLFIQEKRFDKEWEALPDTTVKTFMNKLCSEINKEFEDCQIIGYVYDTDSGIELAYCEQIPDEEFTFEREQ